MDDIETPETTEDSFGTEIAKALILSAVSAAGTVGGLMLIGAVVGKIQQVRVNRIAKTTDQTEE